ncbi:MAG TPA: biopolymer transporter ExbD [Bacteroidales bacterium]|nr:biopolymer transporter ExbD [Bacteroidales bacterium]HON20745.1 biopolymer transporter ExbD [Bacteroidales bacterium]HOR81138.1 biopolymer transporter ExbD [Bacteroidales bacterium]HPJ90740.1 biopolymer transporter ExbD [Bacteroidales bacterium]HPX60056.1 biopolymer transporter ExbD [Bacteroidales bacterium]
MARFKKEGKAGLPELNMSSMSDIIFMFLFFFMVISTMRETSLFVVIKIPQAMEVQKLEKKALVSSINIGKPNENYIGKLGPEPRIQLNDQFAEPSDIIEFVEVEKQRRNDLDRTMITWSLKVDENVKMGIVTDVKQELRKASAFKVNYTARKKEVRK